MIAKLIGEKSAGMTAVEIYDGEDLVWSCRYFDDGCTDSGYKAGLWQAFENLHGCAEVADYEGGAMDVGGGPILMDDAETTGVICCYDSDTKTWTPGDYTLGQSVEIAAALMMEGYLPTDGDVMDIYEGDSVVSYLVARM